MKSLSVLLALTATLAAADWPQYRGPNGDGSTTDKVSAQWGAGPKVLWKVPAGSGFSSFAVAGGKCYAIEGKAAGNGVDEVLVARDAASGRTLWQQSLGVADYGHKGGMEGAANNNGGDGPRSTPTVAGNVVITTNSDL